jgi:hypothetical protein
MSNEDQKVSGVPSSAESEPIRDERTVERIPFDASVEVGGSLGPSFEATAVNVSKDGMQLRTAYLPEIGQPVACRFDAGAAGSVLASGEVVWKQEQGEKGGEFGIKFTDLDGRSAEALERIVGLAGNVPMAQEAGSRVRLHIDGLGSPMRARIRDSKRSEVTVGSDLGFLQVGKMLELEDSDSGDKRPAHIDRVEVEIDPESRIPRLVVALRYDDVSPSVRIEISPPPTVIETAPPAAEAADDDEEPKPEKPAVAARAQDVPDFRASGPMSVISRGAAMAMPMIQGVAKRARTTLAMLAATRFSKKEADPAPRRMTAPPPGGALHTSGRKVVRAKDALEDPPKMTFIKKIDKKRVAAGAAIGLAAVLAYVALHKPPQQAAPAPNPDTAQAAAPIPAGSGAAVNAGLPPLLPANAGAAVVNVPPPLPMAPLADAKHPGKVTPFGNPSVTHGNVLRLKMDGAIDRINGASEPTGFLVSIPGHKSVEAAGPLAARDGRIASIKVSNDSGGAELSVAFKDGVPQYQVRAKGDVLEIVLAPPGKVDDGKKQNDAHGKTPGAPVAHHKPAKPAKH